MAFEQVEAWLPRVMGSAEASEPARPIGPLPAAFGDDFGDPRWALRVVLHDDGHGGVLVDLGESDPPPPGFGIDDAALRLATAIALARALGRTTEQVIARVSVTTGLPGPPAPPSPEAHAFVMARAHDAVLGALQRVWPDAVGAGSCSLGALVQLDGPGETVTEVLPGGEGATPARAGEHAWSGPILASRRDETPRDWVTMEETVRAESGGVGERCGGNGIVRRYRVTTAVTVHVRADRVRNPPHGIDRAGPPRGTEVQVIGVDGVVRSAPSWGSAELAAGEVLVIHTCGGAGHGFPGYGDIEFDASEWFGSGGDEGSS